MYVTEGGRGGFSVQLFGDWRDIERDAKGERRDFRLEVWTDEVGDGGDGVVQRGGVEGLDEGMTDRARVEVDNVDSLATGAKTRYSVDLIARKLYSSKQL